MPSNRIYLVTEHNEKADIVANHLVRAPSQSQAVRHVVAERFVAEVATQDEIVQLVGGGARVSDATA